MKEKHTVHYHYLASIFIISLNNSAVNTTLAMTKYLQSFSFIKVVFTGIYINTV